jgi:sulfite reductase alpha subunit-like flavoprotein
MARDVNETLLRIVQEHGQASGIRTPKQASDWIKQLKNSGRFLEDVWS